jgi:hypothetical protein
MSNRDENTIRVPLGKPRNPYVKELFDDTYKSGRHEPKKERFKPDYESLVHEEEDLIDYADEPYRDPEEDQNWHDYIKSQNIATEGGNVTPENDQT